jgi:hypothetical protein
MTQRAARFQRYPILLQSLLAQNKNGGLIPRSCHFGAPITSLSLFLAAAFIVGGHPFGPVLSGLPNNGRTTVCTRGRIAE